MAKSANEPEPADQQIFDVAISFLVADEKLARSIKSKLAGLNVFFYPHNQEELIGTNGLESMRAPFLSARVNVALYRERYGKTPWTGVELAAIQDSCLKTSYRSLLFVQLDKKDPKPDWLPDTHIRCVLGDFTIDQLVGAIKNKVQELGGVIQRTDAMSEAQRVKLEAEYFADRDAMMRDGAWIENTVHRAVGETMQELCRLARKANSLHGFQIHYGAEGRVCTMRSGFVSFYVGWRQPIFNNVGRNTDYDCYLWATEFSGCIALPGEDVWFREKPRELNEYRFYVEVAHDRTLVWNENGRNDHIPPSQLADRLMRLFFDLISRANQGAIPKPVNF